MNRLIILTTLIALTAAVACDDTDTPQDRPDPTNADDSAQPTAGDIRGACYHFEVDGPVKDSATCLSHTIDKRDDGGLTIELAGKETNLTLELPRDLTIEQYPVATESSDTEAGATIEVLSDDELTSVAKEGTLTVMRIDDSISALFDFEATSGSDDPSKHLSTRGHLRQLDLDR